VHYILAGTSGVRGHSSCFGVRSPEVLHPRTPVEGLRLSHGTPFHPIRHFSVFSTNGQTGKACPPGYSLH
jgi:hypothetical protein